MSSGPLDPADHLRYKTLIDVYQLLKEWPPEEKITPTADDSSKTNFHGLSYSEIRDYFIKDHKSINLIRHHGALKRFTGISIERATKSKAVSQAIQPSAYVYIARASASYSFESPPFCKAQVKDYSDKKKFLNANKKAIEEILIIISDMSATLDTIKIGEVQVHLIQLLDMLIRPIIFKTLFHQHLDINLLLRRANYKILQVNETKQLLQLRNFTESSELQSLISKISEFQVKIISIDPLLNKFSNALTDTTICSVNRINQSLSKLQNRHVNLSFSNREGKSRTRSLSESSPNVLMQIMREIFLELVVNHENFSNEIFVKAQNIFEKHFIVIEDNEKEIVVNELEILSEKAKIVSPWEDPQTLHAKAKLLHLDSDFAAGTENEGAQAMARVLANPETVLVYDSKHFVNVRQIINKAISRISKYLECVNAMEEYNSWSSIVNKLPADTAAERIQRLNNTIAGLEFGAFLKEYAETTGYSCTQIDDQIISALNSITKRLLKFTQTPIIKTILPPKVSVIDTTKKEFHERYVPPPQPIKVNINDMTLTEEEFKHYNSSISECLRVPIDYAGLKKVLKELLEKKTEGTSPHTPRTPRSPREVH